MASRRAFLRMLPGVPVAVAAAGCGPVKVEPVALHPPVAPAAAAPLALKDMGVVEFLPQPQPLPPEAQFSKDLLTEDDVRAYFTRNTYFTEPGEPWRLTPVFEWQNRYRVLSPQEAFTVMPRPIGSVNGVPVFDQDAFPPGIFED